MLRHMSLCVKAFKCTFILDAGTAWVDFRPGVKNWGGFHVANAQTL